MNESLKSYLFSLGCIIINPVKKSLTDITVIGWYCKSTSVLKKDQHIEKIQTFITENEIEYFISEGDDTTATFFIYINSNNEK